VSQPLFSVIVATYDRASLLPECLSSVFQQRCEAFEVIVVDDGSSDDTAAVLGAFADRIRVHYQRNAGPGPARNAGAQLARGRYLAFLDSDDVFLPWTLEHYGAVIAQAGTPAFVTGKPAFFQKVDELSAIQAAPVAFEAFEDFYASADDWRWYGASSFVVRADAFASVGGFVNAPINAEDADLAMKLGTQRRFVQVTSPVAFGYRRHAGSAIANLPRTVDGAWHAVRTEQSNQYPGGMARAHQRRRLLTRHLRSVMIDCVRAGLRDDAWRLYRATWRWNASSGHLRFVAGFPLMALTGKTVAPDPAPYD